MQGWFRLLKRQICHCCWCGASQDMLSTSQCVKHTCMHVKHANAREFWGYMYISQKVSKIMFSVIESELYVADNFHTIQWYHFHHINCSDHKVDDIWDLHSCSALSPVSHHKLHYMRLALSALSLALSALSLV